MSNQADHSPPSNVPLNDIYALPLLPLSHETAESLAPLYRSIQCEGIQTPIRIAPRQEGGFYLLDGYRRCFAAVMANLTHVPAQVEGLTLDECYQRVFPGADTDKLNTPVSQKSSAEKGETPIRITYIAQKIADDNSQKRKHQPHDQGGKKASRFWTHFFRHQKGMTIMNQESRMSEIGGNLKRDVKELLAESANLATGLLKRGLCTARGIGNKWKAFAHQIAGAIESLTQPSFLYGGRDAPPSLAPDSEPIVTVRESEHEKLPVGHRMTLSEADAQMRELGELEWDSEKEPPKVTVTIDYLLDGQTDRYWLPCAVKPSYGLVDQFESYVSDRLSHPEEVAALFSHVSPEWQEQLHVEFGPQLRDDLESLSTRVTRHFQQHCSISTVERQLKTQAEALPQKAQQELCQYAKTTVSKLRQITNEAPAQAAERAAQQSPLDTPQTERPRQSVKAKVRQLRDTERATTPPKAHNHSR